MKRKLHLVSIMSLWIGLGISTHIVGYELVTCCREMYWNSRIDYDRRDRNIYALYSLVKCAGVSLKTIGTSAIIIGVACIILENKHYLYNAFNKSYSYMQRLIYGKKE